MSGLRQKTVWLLIDPKKDFPMVFTSKRAIEDYIDNSRLEIAGKRQVNNGQWEYGPAGSPLVAKRVNVQNSDGMPGRDNF